MSIDRCMDKEHMYTHTQIHYGIILSHKTNEKVPFAAAWIDIEVIILSKSDIKRQICDVTYMWNLEKNCTTELIYKTEIDS